MSLEKFLRNLHEDTYETRPPDWEIDWEDAPLTYKLYRRLPVFPLSSEVPLSLGGQSSANPDLTTIGHFLWHVYGLTQLSQYHAANSINQSTGPVQMYRRFVPSGGGLYPNELYVYLKITDVPVGVYHYDAAHHRLVLLREGDFDSYLARALGNRCDVSACFGAVFCFDYVLENFFYKYSNFAYRLQGLDTGVLIGQLLEVTKRFGYEAGVNFQFLDRAVNHLLGLSDREESVYAVIPLSVEPAISWFHNGICGEGDVSAADLCRQLPVVRHEHYVRSQKSQGVPDADRDERSVHAGFNRIISARRAGEAR